LQPERHQEPHDSLYGKVGEPPSLQSAYLRLVDAEYFRRLDLRQATFLDDPIDVPNQFRFDEHLVRVGETEVLEDVPVLATLFADLLMPAPSQFPVNLSRFPQPRSNHIEFPLRRGNPTPRLLLDAMEDEMYGSSSRENRTIRISGF
jgi:hypothetical protein